MNKVVLKIITKRSRVVKRLVNVLVGQYRFVEQIWLVLLTCESNTKMVSYFKVTL